MFVKSVEPSLHIERIWYWYGNQSCHRYQCIGFVFYFKEHQFSYSENYQSDYRGYIHTCIFDDILSEYEEVLGRGRFKLDPAAISILIQGIKEVGEAVSPIVSEEDFPDPDDKVFFCTALAGDAQLVTGNIKHYPTAELVVTPAQFCEIAGI